nr:hypothetical protein [Pseudomonas sp.]
MESIDSYETRRLSIKPEPYRAVAKDGRAVRTDVALWFDARGMAALQPQARTGDSG